MTPNSQAIKFWSIHETVKDKNLNHESRQKYQMYSIPN